MERGVIHNKNGMRLRVRSAMMKKLFDEILVYNTISSFLEYLGKENAILRIRRENVIPTVPMETSDLHRCYAKGRPVGTPVANPLITSGLVNVNEIIRTELGQIIEVKISQVRITFLSYLASNLLRPLDRLKGPADIIRFDQNAKLVIQEHGHLVLV